MQSKSRPNNALRWLDCTFLHSLTRRVLRAGLDDKTAASRNIFARISEVGEKNESYARGRRDGADWIWNSGLSEVSDRGTEEETKGRKYQFVDTVGKMGERGLDSTQIYTTGLFFPSFERLQGKCFKDCIERVKCKQFTLPVQSSKHLPRNLSNDGKNRPVV